MTRTYPETIADRYAQACRTPSDINEHLPYFADLVVELDAKTVIELGTRTGVSTSAWLYGLDQTDGHLWSVDLDEAPEMPVTDRWTFIQGDDLSREVFNALPLEVDAVFIDTSHMYDHTRAELNLYRWKLKPGGVLLLHDTNVIRPIGWTRRQPEFPVRIAVEDFCRDEGLTPEFRDNNNGLGLVRMG